MFKLLAQGRFLFGAPSSLCYLLDSIKHRRVFNFCILSPLFPVSLSSSPWPVLLKSANPQTFKNTNLPKFENIFKETIANRKHDGDISPLIVVGLILHLTDLLYTRAFGCLGFVVSLNISVSISLTKQCCKQLCHATHCAFLPSQLYQQSQMPCHQRCLNKFEVFVLLSLWSNFNWTCRSEESWEWMDSAHAHLSSTADEEDSSFQVLLLMGRKYIYIFIINIRHYV